MTHPDGDESWCWWCGHCVVACLCAAARQLLLAPDSVVCGVVPISFSAALSRSSSVDSSHRSRSFAPALCFVGSEQTGLGSTSSLARNFTRAHRSAPPVLSSTRRGLGLSLAGDLLLTVGGRRAGDALYGRARYRDYGRHDKRGNSSKAWKV